MQSIEIFISMNARNEWSRRS